jgi:hypothetical protein
MAAVDWVVLLYEASMSNGIINRRRFLLGTALGGVVAAVAPPTAVKAFSEEELPLDSVIGLAYGSRCSGGDPDHAAIKAQLQADLATKTAADGTVLSEQQPCPLCGCPIIATRQF